MPLFISQSTLKEAVSRLGVCSATSSLIDYLIFRRAFKIAVAEARTKDQEEPSSIVTGLKSEPFVQAVEEVTLRVPRGTVDPKDIESPYYVPFGSKRDKTLGYRTQKYPSNGSSDTVGRWQSRSSKPLVLVPDTSPKEYTFTERTAKDLEDFFMVSSGSDHNSGEKPLLLDVAVWWFRFTDLEQCFAHAPTADELIQAFIDDFGLTPVEVTALFAQPTLSANELLEEQSSNDKESREEQ